jgi:hypothetical protein
MKKYIKYFVIIAVVAGFSACQEEFEPGGTAVEEMAGTWTVLYNHSTYGIDPFGVGKGQAYTYNTSDNSSTEMWLADLGNFWEYKVKVPIDMNNLTFGTTDTLINAIDGYDIKVLVRNGKIIPEAANPPSGTPIDSIYFEIWFEDLAGATGIESDTLFVSGYRYSGWPEDE